MVLYPNKLPESERVCSGICRKENTEFVRLMHYRHTANKKNARSDVSSTGKGQKDSCKSQDY